jgi:iron complex transport system permease protein
MISIHTSEGSGNSPRWGAKIVMLAALVFAIVLSVFWGPTGWFSSDDLRHCFDQPNCMPLQILSQIRLPRLMCAAIVGMALATAGVVSQALFRNDLASPSVTGAESVGLLGASLAFIALPISSHIWSMPIVALGSILIYTLLLSRLSQRWYSDSNESMLLVGVSVGAASAAITSLVISILTAEPMRAASLLNWLMGSLNSRSWSHVFMATPFLVIGSILALRTATQLDYLSFGREFSTSIGINVPRLEIQLILTVSLLIGASLSVAGGVVFAGLIVPHFTRFLLGPKHRSMLRWSAINGISLLLFSDVFAKSALQSEIHTGTMVGLIGAPFFCIILLTRTKSYRSAPGEP